MKFLKQKTLSKFTPNDQTLFTNQFGRAVMNLNGGLRLPQGTTAQRPDPTKGRWPGIAATQTNDEYADGTLRYNITTNSLECLISGVWEVVKGPSSVAITRSTFGPGDAVETVFGPLDTVEPLTSYQASDFNIIVLVENVFQIGGGTNYSVQQSVSGSLTGPNAPYADGWYVKFTSPVPAAGTGGNPVFVTVFYGYGN